MAFDNVFGRIDFQSGNKMAMAKQQQNMQMVGQALGQYNKQKDRDLQTRQLDMKANEEQAFNLKRVAEQAAYKAGQGMELSPQEQGAIKAYDAMNPNFFTGEFGQQKQATGLAGLLGGQPQMARGINPNAQQPQSSMGNVMDIPPMPAQAVGGLPQDTQAQSMEDLYQPSNAIAGTPYAIKEKEAFKRDLAKMQAQDMFAQKKQQQANDKMRPKAEKALLDTYAEVENATKTIDKAINQVSGWSAGKGSLLSMIPASDAKDLEATLSTIQADAAFGSLQQMRENSPSGGALGSVSERELTLLSAARTSLDQAQSPEQLRANLSAYKDIRQNAFTNVMDAYEKDFGSVPKSVRKALGGGKQATRDALALRTGASSPTGITKAQAQAELDRRRKAKGQ